jgi:hypothetical protein
MLLFLSYDLNFWPPYSNIKNGIDKALNELQDFIHNTLAAHLAPLMYGLSTLYDILQALKKRLALTDRTRRLQLA